MDDGPDDQQRGIAALADRLRASGAIGRSDIINRLFEFLLGQSLAGRSPKEIEIAQEVFGKDARFDVAQDASVRVHIHRLRKKLDEVYAGTTGDRLVIPRGEYRIVVERPDPEAGGVVEPAPEIVEIPSVPQRRLALPSWAILLGFVATLAIGIAIGPLIWNLRGGASDQDMLVKTPLWQSLAASRRMTFLVTGDYYLFGEAVSTNRVTRLVREFSINSREDLDEYLMVHPNDNGRYVDLDLHYLPVSTGYAMREVLPLMNGIARGAGVGRPFVISMSRLTPEAMKGSNIVYVGFLSGLGLIRDGTFEASGFTVGKSYDELIDRQSGKHYVSDWEQVNGDRAPRRDYAYVSSFPGPLGNRIIVISGTRDAAVMQAGEIAADKSQLDQIAARTGNAVNFEALYEVRTLGTLNLGSRLVLARPLKLDRLWRPGAMPDHFPDQLPLPPTGATPLKP
jgi:hypothetical protein